MNTQPNTTPATPFVLVWNQVATEEWQAGGLARYYSIMLDGGRYTISLCDGERKIRTVATADNLGAAQDAALIDFAKPAKG